MDKEQIKLFINGLSYDLETLCILNDCDRLKETVPVACKILSDIHNFKEQVKASNEPLSKLFDEKSATEDVRIKVEGFYNNRVAVSDQELKSIKYDLFLADLCSTTYNGIKELKKKIKSPLQKKIELYLPIVTIIVILAFIGFKNYVPPNWGLREECYLGDNFEKYVGSGFSKYINFDTVAQMSPLLPRTDHVTIRWQGYVLVPHDGLYSFTALVDDGVRLFIDDNEIVDQWAIHAPTEFSNSLFLKSGPHKIRVDYVNFTLGATIKLYWTPQGKNKEIIPAKFLRQHLT